MSKVFWLEQRFKINLPAWTVIAPVLAFVLLAVHHAEVIANKVGEPFGTLVLAVAVTIIEVALIVVLMSSSSPEDRAVLARDTLYSAVMIVCNAIVSLCFLTGGLRNYIQGFELEGVKKAVSVLLILALMVFMLPNFTTSSGQNQT